MSLSNTKLIFFFVIFVIIYLVQNPKKLEHIINLIENFGSNNFMQLQNQTQTQTQTNIKVESKDPTGEFNKKNISEQKIEQWRDLPYIGNKDVVTYHRAPENVSRKSLPIYYPISSPLEDNYFNYLNSVSSPKLSMLRNLMRSVEVYTNQGMKPIIFNYAERPIEQKPIDKNRIKTLALTVIDLINKFAGSTLRVELVKTINEIHEETELESKINFDMKVKLFYYDAEKLGKTSKPEYDILYIQPEFIFQKKFDLLPEDQFFKQKTQKTPDFRAFLSKLIIVGSEHMGFLGGRYGPTRSNKMRGREFNV
jgi:hypothetical protein